MAMIDDCREIEPLLALSVTGDVSLDEQSQVDAHLECCEACSAAFKSHQRIHNELATMTAPFDEQVAAFETPQTRFSSTHRKWQFGMGALAAFAALFISAAVLFPSFRNTPGDFVASVDNSNAIEEPQTPYDIKRPDPFIERPTVRLIESTNESATGIVSTIYTDNPDIVIAWISD